MSLPVLLKELVIKEDGYINWGKDGIVDLVPVTEEGTWRYTRLEADGTVGTDAIFYRYESGVWVEKRRVTV